MLEEMMRPPTEEEAAMIMSMMEELLKPPTEEEMAEMEQGKDAEIKSKSGSNLMEDRLLIHICVRDSLL